MAVEFVVLGPEFDWLPDDTEESVLGTSAHQDAITAAYTSLMLCGPRRGLPWFVGNQIKIVIPRRSGELPYRPYPDLLVHATAGNFSRSSLSLAKDGPPALVIEFASPATAVESDINLLSPIGKPGIYEAIGVKEYIVFDSEGEIIKERMWARRAGPNGYEPWEAEADGRWHSAALGIAFAPRGLLLRVYDQDGVLVPITEELADLADEHRRQLAERDRRLAALEEELHRLRGS